MSRIIIVGKPRRRIVERQCALRRVGVARGVLGRLRAGFPRRSHTSLNTSWGGAERRRRRRMVLAKARATSWSNLRELPSRSESQSEAKARRARETAKRRGLELLLRINWLGVLLYE